MIRRLTLAALIAAVSFALLRADTYPREPDLDVQHYAFKLRLADANDVIAGEATVSARFTRAGVSEFGLDLAGPSGARGGKGMTVDSVSEGGAVLVYQHAENRLRVRLGRPSESGERRDITIAYHGVPGDGLVISTNKYGDRTFFGDNFPDRARQWLPTVDHPSDKATCEFAITAPDRYRVVATGLQLEESDLPGGERLTHWRTSVPISTYNMVIGVARFAVQYLDRRDGVSFQTWAYPQDRDGWFRSFAVAPQIFDFYSFRVGTYAYEKLANVESLTRFGGMENAGNIFYTEKLGAGRVEGVAAHEIAHQWFGDAVTEADWHHAWLSEGFATYLAHLYDEFRYGRERLVSSMQDDRRAVVAFAAKNRDARVIDPRVPENRVLNTYTYQKGAWVLHMLRRKVGDDRFWTGLHEYYDEYRNRTALSEDFRDVMARVSGVDLNGFFEQWLYRPGHPNLRLTWAHDAPTKVLSVTVDQIQGGPPFAIDVDLGITSADGARRIETVALADISRTVTIPCDKPPVAVTVDPETWLLVETAVTSTASGPHAPAVSPRSPRGVAAP